MEGEVTRDNEETVCGYIAEEFHQPETQHYRTGDGTDCIEYRIHEDGITYTLYVSGNFLADHSDEDILSLLRRHRVANELRLAQAGGKKLLFTGDGFHGRD